MLSTSSVSRRSVLAGTTLIGLAALVGCAKSNQTNASNSQPASAVKGGNVTIALDREIPNIDPKENLIGQQPILILANAVYEPIMRIADGGALEPVKAQSFNPGADAATWTLVLKDGLTFSNGDPLNADAVIKHLQRLADPNVGSSSAGNMKQITSMSAKDALTVEFKLQTPNADFAGLFARQMGMVAHPSAVDQFKFPLGAGAYVVTGFQAGNQIELSRADKYTGGEPGVADKLVYKMLPDADSRFSALKSGDVDLVWSEVTKQMEQARKDKNLKVDAAPAAVASLLMNQANAALKDVQVRKAIIQAIDRSALLAAVNQGEGIVVDNPYSLMTTLAPKVDYPAYDEAGASSVLKPKALKLKMIVENRTDTMQRATAVQAMLAKAGVSVEVSPIESANFASTLKAGDFDLADLVTSVFGDANGANLIFNSKGAFNFTKYSNPTVDAELAASAATTDQAERKEHFKNVADAITTDCAVARYTASNAGVISSNKVAGIPDVSKMTLVSINPKTIGRAA